MEQRFLTAWKKARTEAESLGVRLRPLPEQPLDSARRMLSGNRDSDGFGHLQRLGRLDLSLENLATQKAYTALFTDEQVNNALMRLLDAGFRFS